MAKVNIFKKAASNAKYKRAKTRAAKAEREATHAWREAVRKARKDHSKHHSRTTRPKKARRRRY